MKRWVGVVSRLPGVVDVAPRPEKLRGIVVLEGADCSGKTTLAKKIVDMFDARYLHGRIFKDMWRSHVAMVRMALRWADHDLVVIDRLFLSELVYGQVYRGGPAYDLGARCLDRVLMRVGAITVMCVPDDQQHQIRQHAARVVKGEEAYRKIQGVVALYADLIRGNAVRPGDGYLGQLTRYGDFAKRKDVMVYDLDKDGHRLASLSNMIAGRVRAQRKKQLRYALDSSQQNFVGNLGTARTILVGDAVAPSVQKLGPRGPRWPMCWHDGLSAATWLNMALHRFGHDEATAVIVNANDDDRHLQELFDSGLKIVALGGRAETKIRKLGYDAADVLEHPQYHRRFHHGELDDYAKRLGRAMSAENVLA